MDVVSASFQNLWLDFFSAIPNIIAAVVILALGWAFAVALGKIVQNALSALKLDDGLSKLGVQEVLAKTGTKLDTAAFLGGLVRWFCVIVVVLVAANVLKLDAVSIFLNQVLKYVPNLIAAMVMIIAALLLSKFFEKLIHVSMEAAKIHGGAALGALAKWAVLIFGFLAAISQIGIAQDIINIVVTGAVAMVALAGGIAFGIAGKDFAGALLLRAGKKLDEK
jgi:hypothetical protein